MASGTMPLRRRMLAWALVRREGGVKARLGLTQTEAGLPQFAFELLFSSP